jgi:aspartyl-tRNA(Asn)/glutamyl-tRNA(Gln) amidotransferase subunit C
MTKEEIIHLGRLSRIALTETEITAFSGEIDAIISYVSDVQGMVAAATDVPTVGARYNVLRSDIVTNAPGEYTERIAAQFPRREKNYLKVPKIIAQSE